MSKFFMPTCFDDSERSIMDSYKRSFDSFNNMIQGNWAFGVGDIDEMMTFANQAQLDSMEQSAAFFNSKAFSQFANRKYYSTTNPVASNLVGKFVKIIKLDGKKGPFTGLVKDIDRANDLISEFKDGSSNYFYVQDFVLMDGELRAIVTPKNTQIGVKSYRNTRAVVGQMENFIDLYKRESNGYFVADFTVINGVLSVVEVNPFINFWPFDADMSLVLWSMT